MMNCPEEGHNGTETILLVEDEKPIRDLISQLLSGCGYKVLQAGDGKGAVGICREKVGQIGLLLVDLGLPDIRGDKVAQEFLTACPHGRILFMTGYAESAGLLDAATGEKAAILEKPFSLSNLTVRIRQVLDRPRSGT